MLVRRGKLIKLQFIIFIFVGAFLCGHVAFAGWTEDVRLTTRGYEIHPQIIARHDSLHIVWQQVAGPQYVSYMRSTDGGANWDSLVNLTESGHRGSDIGFSLSGSRVFVGWFDIDTNPINWVDNIGFTTCVGGQDWAPPNYVFPHWSDEGWSQVASCMVGYSIYLSYWPFRRDTTGSFPLCFLYSSDFGATWSDTIIIAHANLPVNNLRLQKCAGVLYAAWSAWPYPDGSWSEVSFAKSSDGGRTWSDAVQLSAPDWWNAQRSCIACDEEGESVAVGWMDAGESQGFPGDLYLRLTTDGGNSWGQEVRATHHHKVADPSLALAGDSLWAVWDDRDPVYGAGNEEICFSKSTNLGASWSPYERLTYEPEHSFTPWIAYDDGKVHVVWSNDDSQPDSGMDIYYKRFDPEPDAVGENGENIPIAVEMSAYPNPFNSTISIIYSNLNEGKITIYDIKGNIIRSFLSEGDGDGKISWDATDAMGNIVSSGIYFARARCGSQATSASQSSSTIRLILVK